MTKGDIALEFRVRSYEEGVGYKIPMVKIQFDTNENAQQAAKITRETLSSFKEDQSHDFTVFFDEDLMVLEDRLCLNFEEGISADSMYCQFLGLMVSKFEEANLNYTQIVLGEEYPNDLDQWHVRDIQKQSRRIKDVRRNYN